MEIPDARCPAVEVQVPIERRLPGTQKELALPRHVVLHVRSVIRGEDGRSSCDARYDGFTCGGDCEDKVVRGLL